MEGLVDIARSWIGTPYHHQAARKGAGCDCLGLIRGVWAEASGTTPEPVPPYTPDWGEPQRQEELLAALSERMRRRPVHASRPGDVLLFRMRDGAVAKHLGILSATEQEPRFIHAYSGHGVIESPLSRPWARRVAAVFAFPPLSSLQE